MLDPDGNEWEVFVVLEDNLAETTMCCVPDQAGAGTEPMAGKVYLEVADPCCEPGSGCC